ncbi:hypothetical protein [Streptomyces sp. NPDC087270]|uniref:hypothetical protein n=1 Tax=Streptomyces sp. NPDC087270 TaxID=3365774 RepID=UPI0038112AAF
MDTNTVTAVSATAIACASFVVSVQQGRVGREHNRRSVQPVLETWCQRRSGQTTGFGLKNVGLGPAFVTGSRVWLDAAHLGHWGRQTLQLLRAELTAPVRSVEMNHSPWVLPAGGSHFLLYVEDYDDTRHADLWSMIKNRLTAEFTYESIYGGEAFRILYHWEERH